MVRTYEIIGLTTAALSPSQKFAVVHSMAPKGGERTFAATCINDNSADKPDLEIKLTNGRSGGTATAGYVVVVFNKTDDNSLTGTNHNCYTWYKLSRIQ
jgi:hypothetical protein